MIEGSGSGFIPLTRGSGSRRPKNIWIRQIPIWSRNTGRTFPSHHFHSFFSKRLSINFAVTFVASSVVMDPWHLLYGSGSADSCHWLIDPDPDPYRYLWLEDPDPDPGGPKNIWIRRIRIRTRIRIRNSGCKYSTGIFFSRKNYHDLLIKHRVTWQTSFQQSSLRYSMCSSIWCLKFLHFQRLSEISALWVAQFPS